MKCLILCILISISSLSYADNNQIQEIETNRLVCLFVSKSWKEDTAISCVSKNNIEKAQLEKEVLALQKEKIKSELEVLKNKQKK